MLGGVGEHFVAGAVVVPAWLIVNAVLVGVLRRGVAAKVGGVGHGAGPVGRYVLTMGGGDAVVAG
ncbi:hypothetical protein, partial [Saccharothrix sp. ST-888]|uniref:hypothetical protein n=1 Tax=Saccharothrix sp. ST-888 TaxID=1427391 RepID=UPI001E2E0DEA